jgi:hypothetical protein
MRLTHEEFVKLPMQYVLGINRDDYCARKYWNEQFDIHKEVITDRVESGNIYSGFKEPKVSFYRGAEGKIYDTSQELYDGEFLTPWFLLKEHKPVRDGIYETDLGMCYWGKHHKHHIFQSGHAGVNRLNQPKMWRGMADVPAKEAA